MTTTAEGERPSLVAIAFTHCDGNSPGTNVYQWRAVQHIGQEVAIAHMIQRERISVALSPVQMGLR